MTVPIDQVKEISRAVRRRDQDDFERDLRSKLHEIVCTESVVGIID